MLEVFKHILKNPELTIGTFFIYIYGKNNFLVDWKFNFNAQEKQHFCGFGAWKEYQHEMETLQSSSNKSLLLLLPIIFVDDYLRDKSTKSMSTGIYMTLANFSNKVQFDKKISKQLI